MSIYLTSGGVPDCFKVIIVESPLEKPGLDPTLIFNLKSQNRPLVQRFSNQILHAMESNKWISPEF